MFNLSGAQTRQGRGGITAKAPDFGAGTSSVQLHTERTGVPFPALPRPSLAGSRGRGIIGSPLRGRVEGLGREDPRMQQCPPPERLESIGVALRIVRSTRTAWSYAGYPNKQD